MHLFLSEKLRSHPILIMSFNRINHTTSSPLSFSFWIWVAIYSCWGSSSFLQADLCQFHPTFYFLGLLDPWDFAQGHNAMCSLKVFYQCIKGSIKVSMTLNIIIFGDINDSLMTLIGPLLESMTIQSTLVSRCLIGRRTLIFYLRGRGCIICF